MPWLKKFTEMLFPLDVKQLDISRAYQLKYQNLPPSIFKYREVTDLSLKNLEDGTIWLADPKNLNDPYDCAHSIDLNQMMQDSLRHIPSDVVAMFPVEKLPNNVPKPKLLAKCADPKQLLLDTFLSKEPLENRELFQDVISDIIHTMHEELLKKTSQKITEGFKLCSFTERLDSILMWSHYARYHQGFCLEYDVRTYLPSDHRSRFLYPVIYSDQLFDATMHYIKGADHESFNPLYLNLAALTKAIDWSYEKEWRLLFSNGVLDCAQTYPMGKPKAVYLGSRINNIDQLRIIDICNKQDIQILKMKLSPNRYSMVSCSIEEADNKYFNSLLT